MTLSRVACRAIDLFTVAIIGGEITLDATGGIELL